MKKLNLLDDSSAFKLKESGTLIPFNAFDDDEPVNVSNNDQVVFRIKNQIGFLKNVNAVVSDSGYIFNLSTANLTDLTVGTYQVELAITNITDNTINIYPDNGFCEFTITENALTVTGSQIPVMSLDDFKNELKQYVNSQLELSEDNLKNNFSDYVDKLQNNTLEQSSQALSTANSASKLASSANDAATKASQAVNNVTTQVNSKLDDALSGMKQKVDTAVSGMSENVTNMMNSNTTKISNNSNCLINDESKINGLMSPNLIYNSEFLTTLSTDDSYKLWNKADGWFVSNSSGFTGQTADWYYNSSRDYNLRNAVNDSDYVASQPVFFNSNVVSFSIVYDTWGNTNNPRFYLDFGNTFNMQDLQTIKTIELIDLPIPEGNNNYIFYKKENISVPNGTHWVRLRITEDVSSKLNFFISQPMLNVGSTVLPYISSSTTPAFLEHNNLSDTHLMNCENGSIKVQKLGNVVTVNLIVTDIKSGQVVYQLPSQYRPSSTQQAACVEGNSNTQYTDYFGVNPDGTIVVLQRKFDNENISDIGLNATFSFFIN